MIKTTRDLYTRASLHEDTQRSLVMQALLAWISADAVHGTDSAEELAALADLRDIGREIHAHVFPRKLDAQGVPEAFASGPLQQMDALSRGHSKVKQQRAARKSRAQAKVNKDLELE